MKNISEYNSEQVFSIEFKETRIKKCIKIIDRIRSGVMLDIGCSTGEWGQYWIEKGWKVCGIDINKEHLEESGKKGISTIYCDLNAGKIPYEDNSFDLIFAGEVIEHLIDTDGFVADLYRCVKPGGFVLLTTPNLVSFENRLRSVLGIYPVWVNYGLKGSGHIRAYTPGVLRKQLKSSGFTIIRTTGNWVPFIPQKYLDDIKAPWLSFTGSILPGLAMDIIILAEK
jgi:2-polyprenyl-3-methyl-5-hydroxy-6-metoxy-1,4-benzoquinol methylase